MEFIQHIKNLCMFLWPLQNTERNVPSSHFFWNARTLKSLNLPKMPFSLPPLRKKSGHGVILSVVSPSGNWQHLSCSARAECSVHWRCIPRKTSAWFTNMARDATDQFLGPFHSVLAQPCAWLSVFKYGVAFKQLWCFFLLLWECMKDSMDVIGGLWIPKYDDQIERGDAKGKSNELIIHNCLDSP